MKLQAVRFRRNEEQHNWELGFAVVKEYNLYIIDGILTDHNGIIEYIDENIINDYVLLYSKPGYLAGI